MGTGDGVTRWQNGKTTIFRRANGLPDNYAQAMYQDDAGRVWVFTAGGLAYFDSGRFVGVPGIPSTEAYSITGDRNGNL